MTQLTHLLNTQLILMDKSRSKLIESMSQCEKVNLDQLLNDKDEIIFEALTARFSRLSDFLIQKIFRTLDAIDLEDTGTVRDRINRAEKKAWIDSADDFIKIRTMRNIIAHEYSEAEVLEIYKNVLKLAPVLLKTCINIKKYVHTV
ncbi:hypothetical protein MNBD_GAMMA07-2728 [hydrothermal vent metagenome]|uniref:DUF86 domain-containing protein n=1 Tax=hydrothermal vent metagenome TaxID=652676 RepID=A0A3B0WVE6_9ZZZZ